MMRIKSILASLIIGALNLLDRDPGPQAVTATVYHAVEGQTDDTPFITASGSKINEEDPGSHRWIAVSRDLERKGYTMGTKVLITGTDHYDGIWTVQDRMHHRWENKIDLLISYDEPIGKWDNVTIHKLT